MRSKVSKALRKQFRTAMSEKCPEFVERRSLGADQLYELHTPLGESYFALLVTHTMYDEFTMEGGYSSSGKVPDTIEFPEPDCPYPSGDFVFRVPRLWKPFGEDFWWELVPRPDPLSPDFRGLGYYPPVEEALAAVPGAVDNAVLCVRDVVLPYLRRLSAHNQSAKRGE